MEEKKLSKAVQRRLEAERKAKRKRILFTVVCVMICVLFIVLLVVARDKRGSENNNSSAEDMPQLIPDREDKSQAYSAGLTEDGKIQGIDDITAYVTLNVDDVELKAYKSDYEEEKNPVGSVKQDINSQIGQHMLELIEFHTEVSDITATDYYQTMRELYIFIYNDQYESYKKAYEENDMTGWGDIYEFLGVSEEEYNRLVDVNAEKETIHYFIVQALVEKYEITCTEQDKIDYCLANNRTLTGEADAKAFMVTFGDPYMTQRTLEWKLLYVLSEKTEIVDGSLTDGLKDESEYYSSSYYDNGKIRGIGGLESYISPADYNELIDNSVDGKEVLKRFVDTSEFNEYSAYIDSKQTELEYVAGHTESGNENYHDTAVQDYKNDLAIQFLYDEFGIQTAVYETSYNKEHGLDPDKKEQLVFEKGVGYYNRKVMEFAVLDYLDNLVGMN